VEEELITVLSQFNLLERLPASVAGALRGRREPRPAEGIGKEYITALLLDNAEAVRVAAHIARQKGFVVETDADTIEEQYPRVAARLIEHILRLREANPNRRVGVISGGEVLCPVRGDGAGGRNQEFVLYSAALLAGKGMRSAVAVLSGGTDGIDGNSDAAGAIADGQSVITAAESGLDASAFIHRNDSHSFFRQTQGLLVTGPTGNNVRDLRILLAE
jgi:hydroxypyruvate reductase